MTATTRRRTFPRLHLPALAVALVAGAATWGVVWAVGRLVWGWVS